MLHFFGFILGLVCPPNLTFSMHQKMFVDAAKSARRTYLPDFFHLSWARGRSAKRACTRARLTEPAREAEVCMYVTPAGPDAGAASSPAVCAPRASAFPADGLGASGFPPRYDDGQAPAGGGRGALDHVTCANMAAPSGVHLVLLRGEHLVEDWRERGFILPRRSSKESTSALKYPVLFQRVSVVQIHSSTPGDLTFAHSEFAVLP